MMASAFDKIRTEKVNTWKEWVWRVLWERISLPEE